MINHKPAAPLPYRISAAHRAISSNGWDLALAPVGFGPNEDIQASTRNVTYLVHAANAYPHLVEKGRAVALALEAILSGEVSVDDPECERMREEFFALLRELGEREVA